MRIFRKEMFCYLVILSFHPFMVKAQTSTTKYSSYKVDVSEDFKILNDLKKKEEEAINYELSIDNEYQKEKERSALKSRIIKDLNDALIRKDSIINTYELLISKADSRDAKNKLRTAQLIEMHKKDSIFAAQKYLSKEKDFNILSKAHKELIKESVSDIKRVNQLLFDYTFKLTAYQRDRLFRNKPNTRLKLDSKNTSEIRANLVDSVFIEFVVDGFQSEFPDYAFNLNYTKNDGSILELFSSEFIPVESGKVSYYIDISENINNQSFKKYQKGRYKFELIYEQDQNIIRNHYEFRID